MSLSLCRVYSPVVFGKKTDPDGVYIKRYLPKLAKYPAKYIYSPWEAPLAVQKAAGRIIGETEQLSLKKTLKKVLNRVTFYFLTDSVAFD